MGTHVLEIASTTREEGMTAAVNSVTAGDFRVITAHYLGIVIPVLTQEGKQKYTFDAVPGFSSCYELPELPIDTGYTYEIIRNQQGGVEICGLEYVKSAFVPINNPEIIK